ncbi:hypothetical protein CK203_034121 [Vitis vinifera]|uniref:Reverse transcriptase domain-containing protein n=1 Tax=Vitis vinifera TaxID=29760 RepID=A0A438IEX4_VITVI|nr:hypothetical protein CK203_034121 [Vitis vinifera]
MVAREQARLNRQDATKLEDPFVENEVFNALLDLNRDKALGSNGFSMTFWKFSWDFVKEEDLKDFRPISFVSSLYNLLAKALANRLKKVVGKVVSKFHNALVEWRQILDAVLISNETIDSMLKSNNFGVLWFGQKWICWISWCISTSSFSILMDGTSSGLKINLSKSKLIPVRRVENLNKLAYEVSCKVGELPSTYLGLSLGAFHNYLATWDGMEEQFHVEVSEVEIGTIQRDFHLGGGSLERKPHLVNWTTVCSNKSKRGLGS